MKLAVTADLQFDEQPSRSVLRPSGLPSRLEDSIACFDWIVDESVRRGCSRLFMLGDIFDNREALRLTVIDQVCRAVKRASERIPVTVMVGNHDAALRTPQINSAQVFSGMAHVVEEPTVFEHERVALLPWIEDDDAFRLGVRTLAQAKAVHFLFGHCMVEGAVPKASGRPIVDLMPGRWKRILLGDVHDPVELADGKIQYVGSPMQWHYGDAGGLRGFRVLDTETAETEFVENTFSPRFHNVGDQFHAEGQAPVAAIRACDFVRIRCADSRDAVDIATRVRKLTGNVEALTVELPDEAPRLEVRASDPHEAVLRKWVAHVNETDGVGLDVDVAVAAGMEILEAAKVNA
jgi:DNA repair exonuclease SbcCD nuclease subunit